MTASSRHYLVLHGAISNAGDFLIRKRLLALLRAIRPDRRLVVSERWRPLDPNAPETRNASAVILGGGPAWQRNLHPGIYPLCEDLARIDCPIVPIGIGWKSPFADEAARRTFRFEPSSQRLLERIEHDGLPGTSRDAPSLDIARRAGLTHQRMGGCPAWYALDHMDAPFRSPDRVARLAVSPGALHMRHRGFARQARDVLALMTTRYPDAERIAAFHHPLDVAPNLERRHMDAQRALAGEARRLGYRVEELSGSAEAMESLYAGVDLHVGYRVHAHILRASLRGPSVLIAEDSRGFGAAQALGGSALLAARVPPPRLRRLCRLAPNPRLLGQISARLDREQASGWPEGHRLPSLLARHYAVTREVLEALP